MSLTEEQAAKVVLIRSLEESDPAAFDSTTLAEALSAAGAVKPGVGWVERRAAFLFERLPAARQFMVQLVRIPTPWTLPVLLVAFVLGLGTNLLGPSDKIHVVRNPVLFLVGWNLLVYGASLYFTGAGRWLRRPARSFRRGRAGPAPGETPPKALSAPSRVPWLARALMPGLWRFFHRLVFGFHEKRQLAGLLRRFGANWMSVAASLVAARWKCFLHLTALSLAAGAIGGMYFRGLFQGYAVVWASTFITRESAVSTFVGLIFAPSLWVADLAGLDLAERIHIGRLLSPEGDNATAWIHLFAINVLLIVVLPRSLMAWWQWRNVGKLAASIVLPLDSYFAGIVEAPLRSLVEKEVERSARRFAEAATSFVTQELYDGRMVPLLRDFRRKGGRVAELKREMSEVTRGFLPDLSVYMRERALPEFQASLAEGVGKLMKTVGGDFQPVDRSQEAFRDLAVPASDITDQALSGKISSLVGLSIGATMAIALGTVAGGIGEELGLAVVAVLLGTSGPIGFLIGLFGGAVAAGAVWWFGKDRIAGAVENTYLPAPVLEAILWESRFQRMLDQGRAKCREAVGSELAGRLQNLVPRITEDILSRVRALHFR